MIQILTAICLGRASATLSSNVLVGFSEHKTTRLTLRSPWSNRPLARTPTLITPFRTLGTADSSFFSLKHYNTYSTQVQYHPFYLIYFFFSFANTVLIYIPMIHHPFCIYQVNRAWRTYPSFGSSFSFLTPFSSFLTLSISIDFGASLQK